MIERYYNLFDPAKHYSQLLFRAGDGLQSRELNEIQTTLIHRLQGVADALLKDGDIVSGCNLQVNPDTGAVTLEAGRVYLRGAVRDVPAATFTVPVDGRVAVGVRFTTRIVTELEDPNLREPAVGVRNYQEPGAGRLQETIAWGWEGAGTSDGQPGDFHAVYALDNGILENRRQPPVLDGVIASLARYDYDANGHYVTEGLGVRFLSTDAQEHIFSVAEGRANIDGFKVERSQSQRLRLPIDPDLQRVSSEPQVFNDSGDGSMVVTINRPPLAQVLDIKVTQQKTETVAHGAFTGSRDVLTEPTVVAVLEIKQGGTTYVQGTDYKVVGDEIDWSPGGAEPAPGSSYQVTYQYIASITPTELTDTGFKVAGVVQGSTMYIDYQWKLPRVDVLALTADGQVERIKGISQVRNPVAPTVPASRLALAEIAYDWRSGSQPVVRNVAIRTIKVAELTAMQRQIADLYDLMALERLRVDANIREPAVKKGLFVDNFLDDDLRDHGAAQTGAIVAGVLTLPITASAQHAKENGNALLTLDYTLTPVIEQLARTGSMKINPYQAFEPVPARVTLNPAVDQFTVTNTTWASDVTERLITGSGLLEQVVEVRRSEQVLASSSEEARFLRSIDVAYTVMGFGPNEALAQLRFDGLVIGQPSGKAADAAGLLTGSFRIPQAIPAGAKLVEFLGAGGSYGSATYVGRGQIVTETRRRILTTVVRRWDPLAQTFTLPERRTIGGLELWFTTKGGAAPVIVQIRETQVGLPTTTVLTEGRLAAADIKTDGNPTRITLDPVALEANREYAIVVLTDDANHAVSVAELGKYDPRTGWVTAQPYQIGVLLSSSNGITWTPHQTQDLTFRLLGCRFTQQSKTISLGQYTVTNLSDLMALAGVERPAAGTDVQFLATDPQGRIYTLSEDQGLALTEKLSGNLAVSAKLTGSETASPILYPGTQLVFGTLEAAGDYLSRAIPAAATFNVSVTFDALTPGTSSVTVQAESGTPGSFTDLALDKGVEVGNGWVERTYKASSLVGVGADRTTRVKLALSGNPQHRPFVRNLRVIVT
ncbi:DUF4815 domain-containing protein [Acidithiobacillus caldus]|uniref:Virulence-associated protein n=1 Tax=Acidithiobacillus caldus (strain ATCC 51756 / DSM 8584 / KU) TaxID=637389 RepID=A0A059ZR32_ACICK|nr:DUF4815 domain-containing protein [Acidithiobacillus caldus]AFU62893.1 hypothetical protein AcaML1_0048 [Acidithiobacillus phage AcaML1]AIA54023.1 Virulence-associated protein [Acidithiobacillus caldus ATCC 51756]MBU2729843.1 DUF4815 domain-containing protein [Acidithiobacillus caldus]MBU2736766.1 DUF4815 domain-containing protein [Acidithiobacillus caldus ATCC 51756]MBU2743896.1 DUF4815 domain-containing protein [Acidithiobacillus caldus]